MGARGGVGLSVPVVDRGVVVVLRLHGVRAQRVCDLHGGVYVDRRVVGDHPAEERDLDAMIAGYRRSLEVTGQGPLARYIAEPWQLPADPTDDDIIGSIGRFAQTLERAHAEPRIVAAARVRETRVAVLAAGGVRSDDGRRAIAEMDSAVRMPGVTNSISVSLPARRSPRTV